MTGADAPDDVWLFVVRLLFDEEGDLTDMAALRALATSNRRMRCLTLPFLFRVIEVMLEGPFDRFCEVIRTNPHYTDFIRDLTMSTSPCCQSKDQDKAEERIKDLICLGKRISERLTRVDITFENVLETDSQLQLKDGLRAFFRHAKRICVRFRSDQKCNLGDLQYYLVEAQRASELWIEAFYGVIQPPDIRFDYLPKTIVTLLLNGKFAARSIVEAVMQLPNLRRLMVLDVSFSGDDDELFADGISAIAHRLFVLNVSTGLFQRSNAGRKWAAELPRMLRKGIWLVDLQIRGTAVCTPEIVRSIPPTLLMTLSLTCTTGTEEIADSSLYEELRTAVIKLQKSAILLKSLEITHAFVNTKERDEDVQTQLRNGMHSGRVIFVSIFDSDSTDEDDSSEDDSTDEGSSEDESTDKEGSSEDESDTQSDDGPHQVP